jgi:predicted GNAT superfamily acetyltransferase
VTVIEPVASGPTVPLLRPAGEPDLDAVLELNNAAVPAVNALARSDLDWLASVAHTFVVAEEADRSLGGFLIGLDGPGLGYDSLNYAWFSARYDRFIYVDRVVVAESGRGRGTGQRLYDSFRDAGRAEGHDVLLAEVNIKPHNHVSLKFHDRYGFSPVGEQDTENGTKRVVMLACPVRSPGEP